MGNPQKESPIGNTISDWGPINYANCPFRSSS